MVIDKDSGVADIPVDSHGFEHIHVASVYKLLMELGDWSGDIPEVDIQDFVAGSEISDGFVNVVFHLRERALAKLNSVRGTGIDLD